MEDNILITYLKETYLVLTTIGLAILGYLQVTNTNTKDVAVASLSVDKDKIEKLTKKLTETEQRLIEAVESSKKKDIEILDLKQAVLTLKITVKSLQAGFRISNALFESKFKGDTEAMVFVTQMTEIIEAMNSDA